MTNLKIKEMTDTKTWWILLLMIKKYCVMKGYLKWALSELKRWQYSGGSNYFTLQLFNLISKADDENKQKILMGFPAEMCTYLMWYYKESFDTKYFDNETFFKKTLDRLDRI